MFTHLFTRKFSRFYLIAAALIVLIAICLPSTTAYAQDGQPPAPTADPAQRGHRIDERMGKLYQRELEWLDVQAQRLENPEEVIARVEELISTASQKGRDVTALQTALAAYQASVAEAQTAHDEADAILAAHSGFDASGNVTDREAARQTLDSAAHEMNAARRILNDAIHNLRHDVRAWLRAQRPTPVP